MTVKISGVLKDGTGKPVQNCTIVLKARRTSSTVVVNTVASENPDEAGRYTMDVEYGQYSVSLLVEGFPPSHAGTITVYEDSQPGTLNDFLGAMTEDDARPEALRRFEVMVEEVARNASAVAQNTAAAKKSAGDASTSAREAATYATDAAGSARAASTSAGQAATSAQEAFSSAGTASAKASEASKSAAAAESSKSAAATSASAAKTSETNAAASQKSAATSASTATTKASEAATSARGAAASKEAAKTSETNAKASETSAESSKTAAASSASSAASSASSASASKDEATRQASAAKGSATTASTKATEAAGSATAAAQSKSTAESAATRAETAAKRAEDIASAVALEDASTTKKGIVQLSSATNSTSESLAATPKAVNAAYDLANGKYTAQDATTAQKGIVQLSSATNSTSETLAATPKAVKAVMGETNKKAPLNSPALTGTPTTPTARQGTNNTQIASTAFVMAAIAALIDSSPDALNTLNELAAALGNDPNFATTMTNALAGKQPKDATLTALAGLTTAADKFPYFTGNDVASLATLTKVGRDILAKSTVAAVIEYLGLQETIKLASEALSTYGGVVNGDVIIKGILSLIGNELLIEKDNGFSGIHIRNKSTVAGSANGVDFSFGGATMSSLICGIMENGANYIDVALSPAGNISDRRLIAFTLDGNIRQLIPHNGWSIQGYTKNSDFTQAMADAGWVRFPNGIIFQWCWGNTDASGWASAPFPVGWPVRCFGLLACNIAGDSIASAIAGVKRLNDRDMQVTLMERSAVAVSKPFFCIGVGC
ncbi:TPA: prophage tail fiber N-terminal domain-containing protein [Escherichia coli]